MHEERWRALVDSDSGDDASDDEDADATISNLSDENDDDDGHVTYLDLSKPEVQVVSSPDAENIDKCRCYIRDKLLDYIANVFNDRG